MKKVEFIEHTEDLCFSCLHKKEDIKTYILEKRGYGSAYDNFSSKLQLCPKCRKNIDTDIEKWFNEQPVINKYYEEYKNENDITNYILSLPIQGRELFENQISVGALDYIPDSQYWIDRELEMECD